jgi:hypothetical protein
MSLMQAITPENLRAEISRHMLDRQSICDQIGMHVNSLSMYVNGIRPIPGWAAHNLGWAINTVTGLLLFDVDMQIGPLEPPRGRPTALKTFAPPRKKRRKRAYVKLSDVPPTDYQRTGRIRTADEEEPTLAARHRQRQ